MRTVKWSVYGLLLVAFAALMHYSLPDRTIARITGQEVKRQDTQITSPDGDIAVLTRDVNFVYGVTPGGKILAFRNEDTDLAWPPYFKFNTASVASQAAEMTSTADAPKWVIVTSYGWRIEVFSMFPNIVGIVPAGGPEQRLIPWFNIVVVTVLLIGFLLIRRYMLALYGRHVDPLVDAIDQQLDEAGDTVADHYRGVSGFFRRLFGR